MKKTMIFLLVVVMSIFFYAENGNATLINPDPGTFGNDDGSEIFSPQNQVTFSIRNLSMDAFESTFGFFFVNDPTTLHTIFDPTDRLSNFANQTARIDFLSGTVQDLDSDTVQSTFAPGSTGNIAFFLGLDFSPADSSLVNYYTVSSMNVDGLDASGTFPVLGEPTAYLIGFEIPANGEFLSFDVTDGLTPVPEPGTLVLLASGLGSLAIYRNRRRK